VEIVAGVRHGYTMGGPIAMTVRNLDWPNWQGRMDVEPTSGEELESLVKEIFDSPPEVLERARKILGK
jgi:chorismate synthase